MLALVAAACGGSDSDSGSGDTLIDNVNVAYFAGWPLPPQIGQEDGSFAAAMGAEQVTWIPFPDGGSMADAMISGDVDISYSIGLTPFAVKATNGAPITMIGIAVGYADADNCFVSGDLGYTRDNAAETLQGATILTPIGNITHYKLLSTLDFLGVDQGDVEILPHESGDSTAAAFANGQIQVGCAFGGPLVTMAEAVAFRCLPVPRPPTRLASRPTMSTRFATTSPKRTQKLSPASFVQSKSSTTNGPLIQQPTIQSLRPLLVWKT